jgi:SAM-dependent MidA family methyltransferase
VHSAVEREIRELIGKHGRITFARFMRACLYSPRGGFYAARSRGIGAHFGTSSLTHPVFGALIARQLEQMWRLLGEPVVFHVVEAGSGDGALARSIVDACRIAAPGLARALCYVAADVAPRMLASPQGTVAGDRSETPAGMRDAVSQVRLVQTDGIRAFRNIVGCVLSNELVDNFPVHRFAIRGGRVMEVFVTLKQGDLVEALDEPSSPRIAERLADLGLTLEEGYRGEVNLALEDWTSQVASALNRGFVLTIDYGEKAADLYAPANREGTLVCYHRHAARSDPYRDIGQQDITSHVDFTSLMRLGERHGLAALGYATQREFLTNLGFSSHLDALAAQRLSQAREALSRMAMNALVDPQEYGDLKVLAQAKGIDADVQLTGFARGESSR